MKKFSILITVLSLMFTNAYSQVITVTPAIPTDQDNVEVIFDATQGSGGLKDYTGDVYAHTGVLTNLSTSSSSWRYVKAAWSTNLPECKLTPIGNKKYKLVIGPSIRAFYNVPSSEVIKKLAFVFINSTGSLTGKNADGSDIFYDVFPASLSVTITSPTESFLFLNLNQSLNVEVSSL